MKASINIFGLFASGLILTACVTSGMQGEEADKYRMLFTNNCQLITTYDGTPDPDSLRKVDHGIWIFSVVEGKDNWKRIDLAADSFRGDLFYNSNSGETVCGTKNWDYRNRKLNLEDAFG
ncbi:MAG: hypothetical protein OQK35_02460 [Alphaproteobacteria bacterium]|nr:hypothetical protein [Alphaproteobacteria bacterium]